MGDYQLSLVIKPFQLLDDWRNDTEKDTSAYIGLKRVVCLPAGILLGSALLIEGLVRGVFAVLSLPLIWFDKTREFHLNQTGLALGEIGCGLLYVGFSFSQLFTSQFEPTIFHSKDASASS